MAVIGVYLLVPVYTGSMAIREFLERFDDIADGDVFIINDPYIAAEHQNDVQFCAPFFHDGRVRRVDRLHGAPGRPRRDGRRLVVPDRDRHVPGGAADPARPDRPARASSTRSCGTSSPTTRGCPFTRLPTT